MPFRAQQGVPKPKPGGRREHDDLIAKLASLPKTQAKQLLGEKLFTEIAKYEQQAAGKITGMLLELEISELVVMLKDSSALHRKMAEARTVLQRHVARQRGQPPAE